MKINVASRLGTDTPLISSLITDIKRGEVKIPQFQRKFVWKEAQAFDLLDSIANNYPIGSLLFWRTTVKLAAERNIGDFRLPQTDDLSPTDYVLDGQQRLTVIYSCLGAPDEEEGFAAAYNLKTESFIQKPADHAPLVFPLRWMFDTTKLLNFRTGLMGFPEAQQYQESLDTLIRAFTEYRIPVVTLKDLTVEEVCPIFERINSSGTKLSIFDLMVAATWRQDFNLDDEVELIKTSLESKGFGDMDSNTVLKCLSAVKWGGIRKEQIISLRGIGKDEMEALVNQTKEALLKTVDSLTTEFQIFSWDFLPYEALVIILSYVYAKAGVLSPEKISRVRQWFWRAAFSERYRVGGEAFVSNDLEAIYKFIIDEKGFAASFGTPPNVNEWRKVLFRSNNSRSRAFVLALALRCPRNLTNGALIDTADALSIFNRKQFHHVYPRAYLRRVGTSEEENLLLNICMLAASENNAISDRDPGVYLAACAQNHDGKASKVFRSNLLPDPDKFDYASAAYEDFLAARAELLRDYVEDLCNGDVH